MTRIYSLTNPLTGKIFYIGKTRDTLKIRLRSHLYSCRLLKTKTHLEIYNIVTSGNEPIISIIQNNISSELRTDWAIASRIEKRWINYFIAIGNPLTNIVGVLKESEIIE